MRHFKATDVTKDAMYDVKGILAIVCLKLSFSISFNSPRSSIYKGIYIKFNVVNSLEHMYLKKYLWIRNSIIKKTKKRFLHD